MDGRILLEFINLASNNAMDPIPRHIHSDADLVIDALIFPCKHNEL